MDVTGPLSRLAAAPAEAAILLDVDGTLAPIVERPEDASVPERTRAELRRLVDRYALVGCISGRASNDARRVVGVEGIRYVGEHGLELDPLAEEWSERVHAFADDAPWPAERKRLSVSFHYRTAPDPDVAREELELVAERALEAGLRPRWGRMVLEVRPPLDADKGEAVRRLLAERGLRRALYAGDDTTDLDAFLGLDGLDVALRIAVSSDEAPSDLGRAADLVVGSPEALLELLQQL